MQNAEQLRRHRGWCTPPAPSTKTFGVTPQVFRQATTAKPSPKDCTTEQLFEIVMDVARQFRTAKEIVAEHTAYILRLKTEVFKIRFGSLGVRVPVRLNADGKGLPLVRRMHWKEFCECQFGVTADWINRICGGKADGSTAADEQGNGGTLKSLRLDGHQQAALVRSGIAANALVAALKSCGDWRMPLAEYEKVAVAPANLQEYLSALEHEPDWKLVLAKLVSALELSGDALPFIVKKAMRAARTLLGDDPAATMTCPAIPYPGGKGRLASTLVSFMPSKGRLYLEPFAGRGNVFWAAASAPLRFERWELNDINTAPFFEAIRAVGSTIEVPEKTRVEFHQQRTAFLNGNLKAILLEPYFTFGGGGYVRGGWGGKKSATAAWYTRTLRACHRLMASTDVRVTALDWTKVNWHSLGPDDFVYFDPPYLGADVRPYGSANVVHDDLVGFLKAANFKWMLSEYPSNLYLRELGQPFFAENVQLKTANYRQNGGKERRIECAWKNY